MEQITHTDQLGRSETLQAIRDWIEELDAMPSDETIAQLSELYGIAQIVVYALAMATIGGAV